MVAHAQLDMPGGTITGGDTMMSDQEYPIQGTLGRLLRPGLRSVRRDVVLQRRGLMPSSDVRPSGGPPVSTPQTQ